MIILIDNGYHQIRYFKGEEYPFELTELDCNKFPIWGNCFKTLMDCKEEYESQKRC